MGVNHQNKLLLKSLNRQIFNPTVIKHRQLDCHIATAKQCGTHWIKYMLSMVLCDLYDLPKPEHIWDHKIVGRPKNLPEYKHIPQIVVTHSHPHYLLRLPRLIEMLDLPKFMVGVRDPRDILVSAYEKGKGDYINKLFGVTHDVTFSEFLTSSIDTKKPFADIWSLVLFFNAWGPILDKHPEHTLLMHYETLKKDTPTNLKVVCDFIGIEGVTTNIIETAIENSSRKKMKKKIDPEDVKGDKSVNLEIRSFKQWYSPKDRDFVDSIFAKHLKYDFGYDLQNWSE